MRIVPLQLNGERFTAKFMDITGLEHIHRYQLASLLTTDLDVLDIACGAGYGAAMIAEKARSVVGVDASSDVIAHARRRYQRENLTCIHGFCAEIPLEDSSVDVVVSYETLEHIFEQDEFINECRRVLRPRGKLLISTPNVEIYNHNRQDPNPFHVKELSQSEFKDSLARVFPNVSIGTQGLGFGSLIRFPQYGPFHNSELIRNMPGDLAHKLGMYLIAIASVDNNLDIPHSFCVAPVNVAEEFRHLAVHVEWLRHAETVRIESDTAYRELQDRAARSQQELSDRDTAYRELQGAIDGLRRRIDDLQNSVSWRVTRPARACSMFIRNLLAH